MNFRAFMVVIASLGLGLIMSSASAGDDFEGLIESKAAGDVGPWVIGGRTIYVTENTELDISDGPLDVGACVEVDIDDGWVEEIERERNRHCDDD